MKLSRRNVLQAAGAAGAATVAGCLGGDDETVSPHEVENPSGNLEDTLNVWNWYMDYRDWSVDAFGEEYEDVESISTSAYSNPAEWFSRLESDQHEIDSIGSTPDWTVRAREAGHISPMPLDEMAFWEEIPEFIKDIIEEYHAEDGDVYSAPQGVLVNPTLTYNEDVFSSPPDSWSVLWDDEFDGEMFMWDRSYYACMIAAMYTGQDPFHPDDYDDIQESLIQQRDYNVTYWQDFNQARGMFVNEEVVVGPLLDGQTFMARFNNDAPITYTVPEEGAFWALNDFVIPADAPHPNAAVTYTDYVARPENNKHMMTTMGYRGAFNDEMMDDLYADELESGEITEEMLDFHRWDEFEDRLMFEEPLDEDVLDRYDEIWNEVKAA